VALDSLKGALELSDKLDNCSLLTLPLSKAGVQASGEAGFLGHTEFLENYWSVPGVMSFFGEEFNVALLTRHCPIDDVSSLLRPEKIIETINTCRRFFERRFPPKFALLGLNPHAGEEGLLGVEEEEVLRPAMEKLRSEGLDIIGPFPADSFLPVSGGDVDMIFSCYHDQGLVPFKQLHFFTGIQATLGLPIPRVSPDHGTAASIAGTGQVDPRSTINCLRWLRRWWGAEG
jgi:4-hydroxythreonine-4-phosphate dehydrogenase